MDSPASDIQPCNAIDFGEFAAAQIIGEKSGDFVSPATPIAWLVLT